MAADRDALMRDIVCRLSGTGSPVHPADATAALLDSLDTEESALRAALSRGGKGSRDDLEKVLARAAAKRGAP